MKNIIPSFYLVSLLLFSCEKQVEENELIGNWEVVEFKANTPELSPALIESARTEALSTSYSFRKDKTFNMKSDYYSSGKKGKYEFIIETSKIKMTYTHEGYNSSEGYKIELLNSDSMKWKQKMGELGNLTMTLKKE